jgi:RecA-family ATPase
VSISFCELYEQEIKSRPEYIAGGILGKNQVMLLAAPAATYKSIIGMNMAHCLASGEKLFGRFSVPEKNRVLYLDAEVGLHYFQQRLKKFYKDTNTIPSNIYLATKEHPSTNFTIDNEFSLSNLNEEIERTQPNIIILDCLNPFLSDDETEQTFSKVAANVEYIQRRFAELELSFIVLHHMRKMGKDDDPLSWYNVRGSSKLTDWPATRVMVGKVKNKNPQFLARLASTWIFRHAPQIERLDLVVYPTFRVAEPPLKSLRDL